MRFLVSGQKKRTVHETYLGHNYDVLPWNVVFLKCLPDNALRVAVRVEIGRVKCVDAVVVSASERIEHKQRKQRSEQGASEDSRKLDMFQPLLLTQHPFLPRGGTITHTSYNHISSVSDPAERRFTCACDNEQIGRAHV